MAVPGLTRLLGLIGVAYMGYLAVLLWRADGKLGLRTEAGEAVEIPAAPWAGKPAATLGLRPEHLSLSADGPLAGKVLAIEHLGSETLVHVERDASTVIVKTGRDNLAGIGEAVRLSFDPNHVHLFAADTSSLRAGAADHTA